MIVLLSCCVIQGSQHQISVLRCLPLTYRLFTHRLFNLCKLHDVKAHTSNVPAKGLPTVVGKIWILLDMAVFLKKSIFLIIRLLGAFGMVRNTPTGCGNNLPILLRSNIFAKIEKYKLFVFELIFDFFRNLGTREM